MAQKQDARESAKETDEPEPHVGTDPMSGPEEGKKKHIVAPDKEKVDEAERRKKEDAAAGERE